jgi:hypothetical protein
MAEGEGKKIAGMDPIAAIALAIFTVGLICYGMSSSPDETDPLDPQPTVSVSTR